MPREFFPDLQFTAPPEVAFRRFWAKAQLPSASTLLGKAGAAFYLGIGRIQDQASSRTAFIPTSELSALHLTQATEQSPGSNP